MAERENQIAEAHSGDIESTARQGKPPARHSGVDESQESGAKGMLRDAIRSVMEEIERHEAEAKKHLQQAAILRKELRESIAFLHEQAGKKPRIAVPEETVHRPDTTDRSTEAVAAKRKRARKK